MKKDYQDYSLQDFLRDDDFKEWVTQPGAPSSHIWENFLQQFPEKREVFTEAKNTIQSLPFEKYELSDIEYTDLWRNIELAKNNYDLGHNEHRFAPWLKIAAAVTLVIIAGISLLVLPTLNQQSFATSFGEKKTITLPDHSVVTLNANSKVSFSKNFNEADVREVYLEGEAYFSVRHTQNNKKFLVTTSRKLQVEVVGTEFNVNARNELTRVVLNSGKVKLNLEVNNHRKKLHMSPGELVEYKEKEEKFVKLKVSPKDYSSWKENVLVFNDMPLGEIAQMLEDNYGLSVKVSEKDLLKRKYTGSAPSGDVDVLLTKISKVFGLQIDKEEKQIIISKRKN